MADDAMSEEQSSIDLDKELAPVAEHLIAGNPEKAFGIVVGLITAATTGSPLLAAIAARGEELGLATAICKSSYGKLNKEIAASEKECEEKEK